MSFTVNSGMRYPQSLVNHAEIKSCILWMMTLPEDELDGDIAKAIRIARKHKQTEPQIREKLFKSYRQEIEKLIDWQKTV